jgi:COP9 signalosome complex subunit 1
VHVYSRSKNFIVWHVHTFIFIPSCQLLIEQRNYSHLTTYVFKADAAIDATTSTAPPAASAPTPTVTAGSKKKSMERDNVQAKLDLATALSNLGQGSYEKAAQYFLKVGTAKDLGDWVGKVCCIFLTRLPRYYVMYA